MKNLMERLLCRLTGHARGKRVNEIDGIATFRCPRCQATWTRKVKSSQ